MANDYNNKKYYWIKLRDNFMTSDAVDFLMAQKDGANYVVLYQMLCLKTINTGGELSRTIGEIIMPYDIDKIVRDVKWFSKDTVIVALDLYKKLHLIFKNENDILTIANYEKMVGSETQSAIYKQDKKQLENFQLNSNRYKDIKILDIKNKDNKIKEEKETNIEILNFIENNIRTITSYEYEFINDSIASYGKDIVLYAYQKAFEADKKSMNYVKGILKSWKQDDLTTIEQIKLNENKPKNKKTSDERMDEVFEKLKKEGKL